ncbi:MAG: hypothetical protein CVT64_01120 [Actinobacteria bacterium HGW-Actinobacteria-4]|nr:MAG: hypothetical protein CVT64_01120 [Actinobacteria bacterium HGW-Actinobacteria-4]
MNASTGAQRHSLLEDLVERLEFETFVFEPARDIRSALPLELPGREPGAHLGSRPAPVTLASTVLLDCGISRRVGYTHVLWISLSAEAILGSFAFSRVGEVVGALKDVSAYEWEGLDRLHLCAPGVDWDDVLADARQAVDALIS